MNLIFKYILLQIFLKNSLAYFIEMFDWFLSANEFILVK